MPLSKPKYLEYLTVASMPIAHKWSELDSSIAIGNESSVMNKNLGSLSFRALLGLVAALGEWMQQRFVSHYDDEEHTFLNEAIWAASIDFRYLNREAMIFSENNDSPIFGPLQHSKFDILLLCDAYSEADFGMVRYLGSAANVVKYVLNADKNYQKWFKSVVTRLPAESSPAARVSGGFDEEKVAAAPLGVSHEVFGTPIPREVYDPNFDLTNVDKNLLINKMLVDIHNPRNPFLHSSEKLLSAGFIGKPYRYPAN